jgi:uncharacterized damage-inducible protein DinB
MPKEESSTSGPSAIEQYKARIAAFVKGKDPIAVQRESPEILARLIEAVPTEKLKQPPAAGRWSIAGILGHLAEAEIATSWRYRQMIENSGATLSSFDQNEWARLGDYDSWESRKALDMFRLLREANLRLFDRLTPDEWQRFGIHAERGRMTVRDLAAQVAGHDLNHIEQVRNIAAGLKPE